MYQPRSKKRVAPNIMPVFTQKPEKLPQGQRELNRDKFRLQLKNNLNKR